MEESLTIESVLVQVPPLRFQDLDFQPSISRLEELVDFRSGGTPPKDDPSCWNGLIPWISASSMIGKYFTKSERKITSYGLGIGSKLAPKGTLLILVRGSMLFRKIPIGFAGIDVAFNQDVKAIFIKRKLNPEFLYQWFLAKEFRLLSSVVGTGIGAGKLDLEGLKSLNIQYPSLPEQQKIASFLSAVDEKIQLLTRKKELLEQYKKGVMQQLFSGKLRFKDENGNDYPDWEEKKLGEVATNISYGMNSSATEFDGNNKYIRITDIDEGTRKYVPSPLTSPSGNLSDKYLLKSGDLLFARTGASAGKSYLYSENDGNVYFAGFLIRFSINHANPKFVFYQTLTSNYKSWVAIMSMRSGQPGINAEEFKSYSMKLPSLPEQEKIANFLSALDKKIELVSTQITLTQKFKKGLLQQMFV